MASNVGLHIYSKEGHLHHGTVNNAVKHWRQQKFYISYLELVHIYRSDGKCSVKMGHLSPPGRVVVVVGVVEGSIGLGHHMTS